jgi:hypothetical protein
VSIVRVPVAHAAAEVDDRAIQERAVAIGRRLQSAGELGELGHLIGAELGVLIDPLRLVAVVRYGVVRFRDADVRVTAAAAFVPNHELIRVGKTIYWKLHRDMLARPDNTKGV